MPHPIKPSTSPTIIHLIAVAVAVVVIGAGAMLARRQWFAPPVEPAPAPIEAPALKPMPLPLLSGLPPLPDAAAVAEERGTVEQLIRDRQAPFIGAGLDGIVLGWIEAILAQDRAKPPLPQRLSAQDAARGTPAGIPALISGRLEDFSDSNLPDWKWLVVSVADRRYALALARIGKDDVVIGNEAQLAGRFLGSIDVPCQGGVTQSVPLLAARSLAMITASAPPLDVISVGDLAEYHAGRFAPPADLYADIDDERPFLETRAYYYTLGQVKLDASTPGALDDLESANRIANDIHQDPARFRGQMFQVTGNVYQAWEDPLVAQDRPFEVGRVSRILLWKRDWGPNSQTVDGVLKTSNKQVLRLYELAVIGDQPLPPIGTTITACGRFIKFRSIPVQADAERDRRNSVTRASGKIYTMFFVSPGYDIAPKAPEASFQWQDAAIALVAVIVGVVMVLLMTRRGPSRTHGTRNPKQRG